MYKQCAATKGLFLIPERQQNAEFEEITSHFHPSPCGLAEHVKVS